MDIFLTTLGCRLNEAELESWARGFRRGGHRVVSSPGEAQVMIVNTCAVTTEAARKSRRFVTGLHRENPSAPLVVTGCFAELEPERAAALAGVDMVIGNRDKDGLVARVVERFSVPGMPALATEPDSAHMYAQTGRTRAFIKVQDGCKNRCTFCVVTLARGDERSRALGDIVAEIRDLAAAGYQEAVLTGVHLGGYGRDLGTDLGALVRAVLQHTDIPRLRLSSLEPWDLPANFWDLWRDSRLMPHLHLPLQSGSDAVLRRMARRNTTAEYAALVHGARAAIPGLTVTTDVIVGFPGESEAEWAETLEFVRAVGFAHVHVFSYSPRQGTRAARLSGQVTGAVKRERSRELGDVAAAMKQAALAAHARTRRPVLWEGRGEDLCNGLRRWTGYTDNYLRVEADAPAAEEMRNRIMDTELVAVARSGDRLLGVLPGFAVVGGAKPGSRSLPIIG